MNTHFALLLCHIQRTRKVGLLIVYNSSPDDGLVPETTPFDPYFPTCPVNDLQNEPALDDLSQIDHSEIAVHTNGNSTSTSTVDLPTLIIRDADDQELNSPHTPEHPNEVRFHYIAYQLFYQPLGMDSDTTHRCTI